MCLNTMRNGLHENSQDRQEHAGVKILEERSSLSREQSSDAVQTILSQKEEKEMQEEQELH